MTKKAELTHIDDACSRVSERDGQTDRLTDGQLCHG